MRKTSLKQKQGRKQFFTKRCKLLFHFLLLLVLIYFSWSVRKHKLWTPWLETATWRGVAGAGATPRPLAALRLNEKCFRAFCPLMPLFASDIFKDTVLIGPCDTFCKCRLRKSTGKTDFFYVLSACLLLIVVCWLWYHLR